MAKRMKKERICLEMNRLASLRLFVCVIPVSEFVFFHLFFPSICSLFLLFALFDLLLWLLFPIDAQIAAEWLFRWKFCSKIEWDSVGFVVSRRNGSIQIFSVTPCIRNVLKCRTLIRFPLFARYAHPS